MADFFLFSSSTFMRPAPISHPQKSLPTVARGTCRHDRFPCRSVLFYYFPFAARHSVCRRGIMGLLTNFCILGWQTIVIFLSYCVCVYLAKVPLAGRPSVWTGVAGYT